MTTPHSRATARIPIKQHQIEVDAYSPPTNLLEVDIDDPQTHGVSKNRYTDYEIKMQVNYHSGPEAVYFVEFYYLFQFSQDKII